MGYSPVSGDSGQSLFFCFSFVLVSFFVLFFFLAATLANEGAALHLSADGSDHTGADLFRDELTLGAGGGSGGGEPAEEAAGEEDLASESEAESCSHSLRRSLAGPQQQRQQQQQQRGGGVRF